ncbi:MAG: ABC transporter permease [Oscillospiraceae bacterium]|nr:ABC transporter permease [Oscillospiraceae bacterium]
MNEHKPLVHIVKRTDIRWWKAWIIRLLSVAAALIVCAAVIYAIVKLNPLKVYGSMWNGAFGTKRRSWVTVRDTMMLLCIGIGLAPAFKMRFWNIGAEGQILIGGVATAACMIFLGKLMPTWLLLIVMFAASIAAGAIWGLIPALFKARWNTNETLFTLMMNYVAIQLTSFFVSLWEHPAGSNSVGIINQSGKEGWFPALLGNQYTLNVIIVTILTLGMFIYLRYSKHGYEITIVGESERTARYAGISVKRVIIRTMCLSGAICGVSGFIAVSGASHTISTATAGGRGFTAIIVAWLAKFNAFVMILISLLLVFLEAGAGQIASDYNLNEYASKIIIGIILFFILGSEFFINYRLVFRRKESTR